MPKVLLFQLGEAPKSVADIHDDYPAWFSRAWDGQLEAFDGRKGNPAPNPRDYAGIVITGSPASLTKPEPWMDDAADFVRRAYDAGTPTLGVCFGHQLLGYAFGAKVVRNPQGWEIGTCDVTIDDTSETIDPLFEGLAPRIRVNFTHEDMVEPTSLDGSGLRNLAKSPRCAVQALAMGDHVRSIQFHPEVSGAICRAYIDARRSLLRDPDALIASATDAPDGEMVLRNFRRLFCKV